nr:hypothetical protein CFP56_40387 [Quercus suber]
MAGHTIEKCYKLHGYPPGYKPKGKPIANANQASFNSGDGVLTAGNQCPISKSQCEKLLAFLNSGTAGLETALGDPHHAANASISCMATGAGGVSGESSGLTGSSSQSKVNTSPVFNPTLISAQQDASLYQGEIHLANQISSQLPVDQGIDQTDAVIMIEAMPHHDQMLDSMQ